MKLEKRAGGYGRTHWGVAANRCQNVKTSGVGRADRDDPRRGVFLTAEGEKLAQESRERHQIVENFLLVLGVSPEIARRDAEGMEHHVSEETLVKFREFTLKYGPAAE